MTVRQALNGKNEDSIVLLSFVLKKEKAWLFANPDHKLSRGQASKFLQLIQKRAKHWPVAYLTGHKEFFGLDFKVSPGVLIPRPETELLAELALDRISNIEYGISNIVDIGTGSGAIIISLAKSLPNSKIKFIATDISAKALSIARANARRHGVDKKIKFIKSNLFKNSKLEIRNSLVVSNLPYLTPDQVKSNPDLKWEPLSALVAGKDGLKYYRNLFQQIKQLCHPELDSGSKKIGFRLGGRNDNTLTVLLEHDPSQVSKLRALAKKYFPNSEPTFHRDLSGRYRVLEISIK